MRGDAYGKVNNLDYGGRDAMSKVDRNLKISSSVVVESGLCC